MKKTLGFSTPAAQSQMINEAFRNLKIVKRGILLHSECRRRSDNQ